MPLVDFTLIDDPPQLDAGLERLSGLDVVGVDVERADWDRYFRSAALIQVGGDGVVVIIDPLGIDDLSPLQNLLAERVTVLHALENDIGPLGSAGVTPARIADTAVAASVLGLPTGLETLLENLLGVRLPGDKSAMQRAQWEKRPIPDEMLAYAAADVADLPALWRALEERLHTTERAPWYEQELAAAIEQPPVEQRRTWTRVRGVGRLDPEARARAKALWETREQLARQTDTAPGRIAPDRVLVDLAARPPRSTGELGRRGMRRRAIRDFGDELVAALEGADGQVDGHADGVHAQTRRHGPSEEDRELADQLRTLRADRADDLGIDAGVLCPNRVLMQAVLTRPSTEAELRAALDLRPWQWEQLRERFCAAFGFTGDG